MKTSSGSRIRSSGWAPAFAIAFLILAGDLVSGARVSQAQELWGSSSEVGPNASSLFKIDPATGLATLVGPTGFADAISGVKFDPLTGTLYGILGYDCSGARLITINPSTGAGTLVGALIGAGFDGGGKVFCGGGSDGLVFAADGTLYAAGFDLGTALILRVDKSTGAVLEANVVPANIAGLAFDPKGNLWISNGDATGLPELHTLDPATGSYTSTLTLSEYVVISDLAFAPDGTLYVAISDEGKLATVNTTTGVVTRIGSFGGDVSGMAGLALGMPVSQLTALGPAVLWVGLKNSNDSGAAYDLLAELSRNGGPVTSGLSRCVTGLSRNPTEISVAFSAFDPVQANSGDEFSLKISNRMGTNSDDTRCNTPGKTHTNAVGLRLFYDSLGHDTRLGATVSPNPAGSLFLHSDGSACSSPGEASSGITTSFLDGLAPAGASDRCRDSLSGNAGGANPWKEIGTWKITVP
jgi:sugar lactone lactonase YvrE